MKLFWAATSQRLAETAVAVLGPECPGLDRRVSSGRWAHALLVDARELDHGRHERDPAQHHRRARARICHGNRDDRDRSGRHRSARPRRPRALRAPRLPARRSGRTCAPRRPSRTSRSTGTSRSGRSPSTPTSCRSPRSRCGSRARRESRWHAPARAPVPPTEILVHDRPAPARSDAPRRERALHAAGGARPQRRRRAHRDRRARRGGDFVEWHERRRLRHGRSRRRSRSRSLRGSSASRAPTGSCCSAGRTRSSARTIPEYRRTGESPGQTMKRARGELRGYFEGLIDQRRREPQDDLVSELLHRHRRRRAAHRRAADRRTASCSSKPATRRHATRSAAACSHSASTPSEWEKLRANPDLLARRGRRRSCAGPARSATSRGSRPKTARSAACAIAAGDQLALYFASANRDEDVFDDPFAFRVDRNPNPHLAFGFGEHVCLGAHLARVEIETIFRHLLARLESFELVGRSRALELGGQRQHQTTTAALPARVARNSRGDIMEQRPFGTTGLEVAAVGYGCWEIGGGYGDIEATEFRARDRAGARPRHQLFRHRRGLRHGRVGARARARRSAGAATKP